MAKNQKTGRLSIAQMRKLINKKAGQPVAVDLADDNNATIVKEWIPTGSRWLDSIICRGKLAGIPVGKVTEIAGLEASGKSYMAQNILNPLAQSFTVDADDFPSGFFLHSIDLWFKRIDQSIPVKIQIRPMINGYPDISEVIPFSDVVLDPDEITVTSSPKLFLDFFNYSKNFV